MCKSGSRNADRAKKGGRSCHISNSLFRQHLLTYEQGLTDWNERDTTSNADDFGTDAADGNPFPDGP
jgi:hypothetical protein